MQVKVTNQLLFLEDQVVVDLMDQPTQMQMEEQEIHLQSVRLKDNQVVEVMCLTHLIQQVVVAGLLKPELVDQVITQDEEELVEHLVLQAHQLEDQVVVAEVVKSVIPTLLVLQVRVVQGQQVQVQM